MFVLLYIHIRYIFIYGMSFVRPQHHNSIQPSSPPSPPDEPEESWPEESWPEESDDMHDVEEDESDAQALRIIARREVDEELRGLTPRGGELDGGRGTGMEGGGGPMGGQGGVGGKYHALRVPYIYIDTYITYVFMYMFMCANIYKRILISICSWFGFNLPTIIYLMHLPLSCR